MGKHNWGNYFVAAYKGVFEHLAAKGQPAPAPLGLQIMVHGTVPTGAGVAGWRGGWRYRQQQAAGWLLDSSRRQGAAAHSVQPLGVAQPGTPPSRSVPCIQVAACPAQRPLCALPPWLSCACMALSSAKG